MSKEMQAAFTLLEEEKGISPEVVIGAIAEALTAAYKKQYNQSQNVTIEYNDAKGDFIVYSTREVVDEVFDSRLEMRLEDALALNSHYQIGDKIRFEEKPKDFARTAANAAKQVIMNKMREESHTIIYNEFKRYENEIIQGTVERVDDRAIFINLGKVDSMLGKRDQIPGERYQIGDKVKVYVSAVEQSKKGPIVYVSRTHPELLKRMFEKEIPEVYDGTVEIVSIAREAGDRAKVIVKSNDANVDAIGTIVGPRGSRIRTLVDELHGENMDIIEWNDDRATLIKNALKPAQVTDVIIDEATGETVVVVPDDQLSLAIGKRCQNVRLAAHVTNNKIDIKSQTKFDQEAVAVQAEELEADLADEVLD